MPDPPPRTAHVTPPPPRTPRERDADRADARADRAAIAAIALCVAFGVVASALAARTSPWLDEVWTFELLPRVMHASDVLLRLPHANNHPLNTLYLYWLGDVGDRFALYRLHSIAAGALVVGFGAAFAWRFGRAAAVIAAALLATSFVVVHHASQARGYALMLAGALGATTFLARDLDAPRARSALAYAACTAVAFLANLYYLHTFVALAVWSGAVLLERALRAEGPLGARLGRAALAVARLHALPVAVFAFVFRVFYLPGLTGTQFATDHRGIVVQAVSLAFGGPFVGPGAERLFVFGALAFAAGLAVVARRRDRTALLFALAIALAPALVLAVSRPRALFVRFFAASEVYLLLLVAIALGALARARRAGRLGAVVATAVALAIAAANLSHVVDLVRYGRGQYDDAFRYMAAETVGPVTVASDHVLAMRLMSQFWARLLPETSIVFLPEPDAASPPRFFVRVARPWPPEIQYAGHLYDRDRLFRTSGFGFDWQLYRLVPMADALRRKGIDPGR